MFTIGCDPELFLKKNGKPITAIGLVPGDKKHPVKVEGGAIQRDGLAAEFNTDPVPFNNFDYFNGSIVSVIRQLRDVVKKNGGDDVTLDISSWRDFDPEIYDKLSEEDKMLGCDPDFNAYTGEMNPPPDANTNRRGAAGHLHFGYGQDIPVDHPEHFDNCCKLAKIFDRTVGMTSIIINPDVTRREHYGKAGAFRPKPYGIEYRVPDNSWIGSKEKRAFIFETMRHALGYLGTGKEDAIIESFSDEHIQNIINPNNFSEEERVARATYVLQVVLPHLKQYSLNGFKGW